MVGVCEMCRAFVLFSVCLLMIGLSEVCLAILVDYRTLVNVECMSSYQLYFNRSKIDLNQNIIITEIQMNYPTQNTHNTSHSPPLKNIFSNPSTLSHPSQHPPHPPDIKINQKQTQINCPYTIFYDKQLKIVWQSIPIMYYIPYLHDPVCKRSVEQKQFIIWTNFQFVEMDMERKEKMLGYVNECFGESRKKGKMDEGDGFEESKDTQYKLESIYRNVYEFVFMNQVEKHKSNMMNYSTVNRNILKQSIRGYIDIQQPHRHIRLPHKINLPPKIKTPPNNPLPHPNPPMPFPAGLPQQQPQHSLHSGPNFLPVPKTSEPVPQPTPIPMPPAASTSIEHIEITIKYILLQYFIKDNNQIVCFRTMARLSTYMRKLREIVIYDNFVVEFCDGHGRMCMAGGEFGGLEVMKLEMFSTSKVRSQSLMWLMKLQVQEQSLNHKQPIDIGIPISWQQNQDSTNFKQLYIESKRRIGRHTKQITNQLKKKYQQLKIKNNIVMPQGPAGNRYGLF